MFYAFNSLVHGIAFIVSNCEYSTESLFRPGHLQSAINYDRTFDALGFEVSLHHNLTLSTLFFVFLSFIDSFVLFLIMV